MKTLRLISLRPGRGAPLRPKNLKFVCYLRNTDNDSKPHYDSELEYLETKEQAEKY